MIKSGYVGDIANLLGFDLVVHDRGLSIVDENMQYRPIKITDEGFRFPFKKDGDTYLLQFNDKTILLSTSNLETFSMSKNEANYVEKVKKSSRNKSVIMINSSYINFYQNEIIDKETSIETSFKIYKGMNYMEQATTYTTKNGICKEDITTEEIEGIPTNKHVKRNYNSDGKMTCGSVWEETLATDVPSYIKETAATSETVKTLIEKLEAILPGFSIYYTDKNKDFKEIIKTMYNKKTI